MKETKAMNEEMDREVVARKKMAEKHG
jgi:hypothetical protein